MIETWDFFYPLYLDVARPDAPLLNGISSSPLQQSVTWVQSDSFPLRIHFRRRGAIQAPSVPVALPEELSLVLGGRRRNNSQIVGDPLVFSDTFTPTATETDAWYETTLNLHTAELDALIASVNGPVTLQIDIEVGTRLTYVIPVTILPEAYRGEGDPAPTLGSAHPDRMFDGVLHVWLADQEVYIPVTSIRDDLLSHIDDANNPHSVGAAQIRDFAEQGSGTAIEWTPVDANDVAGRANGAYHSIHQHVEDVNNPHDVTKEQLGLGPFGANEGGDAEVQGNLNVIGGTVSGADMYVDNAGGVMTAFRTDMSAPAPADPAPPGTARIVGNTLYLPTPGGWKKLTLTEHV